MGRAFNKLPERIKYDMDLRKIVDNQRAKMIAAGLKGLEKMDVDALTFEAGMLGCNDAAHVSILMLTRLGESENPYVYAFDAANMPQDSMYIEFLKSAERVSGGEFCPRDVRQRMVAGKERVNFVWRGKSYTYQANIQANWLDDGIIDYINEIINKAGIKDKKFFGFFDGGQGIVLLYNTFEWVVGLLNAMQ